MIRMRGKAKTKRQALRATLMAVGKGTETGEVLRLGEDPVVLGSAREADVVLVGAGVDPKHARISVVGDGMVIEDLGSAAGTFCNDARIPAGVKWPLANGDRVRLGTSLLLQYAAVGSVGGA